MITLIPLAAILAFALLCPTSAIPVQMTYYGTGGADPAPSDKTPGACGYGFPTSNFKKFFVALSPGSFEGGKHCGHCIKVSQTDGQGGCVVAQVADLCPGCNGGIDLSLEGMSVVAAGRDIAIQKGRLDVVWSFVDCSYDCNGQENSVTLNETVANTTKSTSASKKQLSPDTQ